MTHWQPLRPATRPEPRPDQVEAFGQLMEKLGSKEIWLNDLYQADVRRHLSIPTWPCPMTHISIKRRDKAPSHNWRHFQYIKNQLCGPETQGIELYPPEQFLVDSSNQYHLWVSEDPQCIVPFGFFARLVTEDELAGTKQEPFEENMKPADLADMQSILEKAKNEIKR